MKYIIQIAVVVVVMCGSGYGQSQKEKDIFNFKQLGFINEDSSYCYFDGGMGFFEVRVFTINYNKDKHTLSVSGRVWDKRSCESFCDIISYTGSFDTMNYRFTNKNQLMVDCFGNFGAIIDLSTYDNLYFEYLGYSLIECSIDKQKLNKYL